MNKGGIGIHLDTSLGTHDQPPPSKDAVINFVELILAQAEAAEKAGFEYIGVSDRHARTEVYFPSHLILCALIAARTSRPTIGTWCTVMTLHNPYQFAEDTAMIDLISRGRFIPTLAVGYHDDYWRSFGVSKKWRGKRFEEQLKILRLAWSGEKFSFEGEFYNFEDAFLSPKPYQEPHPPIWIGAQHDVAIERAGREGDAWGVDPFPLELELWKRQVNIYKDAAAKAGKEPYIIMMRDGFVAPTRQQAYEIYGEYILSELKFYFRHGILSHHPEFQSETDLTLDRVRDHLVLGSPQDCIESLEKFREQYDADSIILRLRPPRGPSHERMLDCMQLFGEEVIPHFRGTQA